MMVLGILLAFGAMLLVLVALQDYVLSRAEIYRSLRSVRAIELTATDVRRRELAVPFTRRVLIPALRRFGQLGRRFTPQSVVERLSKEVVYAGSPPGWDAERIVAIKILTMGGGLVGGFFLAKALNFH